MKKYHIADVLTFARFICAGLLIFFTLYNVGPTWVLVVFVLGELTDAFDGICARAWHYPNDGKRRWWREHAEGIDQIADISLGVALLLYVGIALSPWFGFTILLLAILIAVPIQIWRHYRKRKYGAKDEKLRRVVIARRILYVLAIYALCLFLLWHPSTFASLDNLLSLKFWLKILLTSASVLGGLVLLAVKRDRLQEDKTPLNAQDFGQQTRHQPPQDAPRYRLGEYPQQCKK